MIEKVGSIAVAVDYVDKVADAIAFLSEVAEGDKKGAWNKAAEIIGSSLGDWMTVQMTIAMLTFFAVSNPLVAFAAFITFSMVGNIIGDFVEYSCNGWLMIFDEIFGLYDEAGAYTYPVDPLIFDLNGDGVKTVALADGVHFDFDKNGFAEKIGWVSAEDGLLVRDLDKNGKIDSGRELMGDLTELSDEMLAANGFEALAYFDANADGVIDSNDNIYSELQI